MTIMFYAHQNNETNYLLTIASNILISNKYQNTIYYDEFMVVIYLLRQF